jgi:hypothetical protein
LSARAHKKARQAIGSVETRGLGGVGIAIKQDLHVTGV